ncbi:NAD(P)H-hydrate dehydratase [Terriglobus albidus]|uniref:NAD(P)H-hydrate dehydratase n=1 Tax=Terriglobus albidus TaxID=1592106 RepID=UPI0021DFA4D6|nr:NAD(P)H-hydrate dehydratase [Terriglobus albidus]
MKILTAEQMGETDRRTAAEFGFSMQELMENAGISVACFALRRYPEARRIVVLCGKGNNGGDGFVAARRLHASARKVQVIVLAAGKDDLRGDAAHAFSALDAPVTFATENIVLPEADLYIDAIFGTGFKPPIRGLACNLREQLIQLAKPVLAVDLPSGWDADSHEPTAGGAFPADSVVTFTAPKPAHIFGQLNRDAAFGAVAVAPIGSPAESLPKTDLTWTGSSKALTEAPRPLNSNKGRFGHVLVLGGSRGKSGAAAMASLAALRSGAGLVTAAVPDSVLDSVARIAPELMSLPLQETGGHVALANFDTRTQWLEKISVLAIGPGLGTQPETTEFVRRTVLKTALPIVIDADALNAFAEKPELLRAQAGRVMVLTPHPGEMARLLRISVKEVEADRIGIARHYATDRNLTLVLKGWRTLVAHPDGEISVNTTGHPAMSKGGSGDILTGIVAAMLAQYPDHVKDAVNAAVYLHGLAGMMAARHQDEHTVLATDTLAHLSDAFRYCTADEDGLTWVGGLR